MADDAMADSAAAAHQDGDVAGVSAATAHGKAEKKSAAKKPAAVRGNRKRLGARIAQYKAVTGDDLDMRALKSGVWFCKAKREKFLETMATTLNISQSARTAGVCRTTIANWRKHNAEFREALEAVMAEAYLDAEAKMLAMAIGVQHSTVVERLDDGNTTTRYAGDAPQLTLEVMRLHRATVAAREAIDAHRLEMARRPANALLAQWLLDDIAAIEAERKTAGAQAGQQRGGDDEE